MKAYFLLMLFLAVNFLLLQHNVDELRTELKKEFEDFKKSQ